MLLLLLSGETQNYYNFVVGCSWDFQQFFFFDWCGRGQKQKQPDKTKQLQQQKQTQQQQIAARMTTTNLKKKQTQQQNLNRTNKLTTTTKKEKPRIAVTGGKKKQKKGGLGKKPTTNLFAADSRNKFVVVGANIDCCIYETNVVVVGANNIVGTNYIVLFCGLMSSCC